MNLAICKKGSDGVTYFVRNAIKKGPDIFGDNHKLLGMKDKHWDFIWTADELTALIEKDDQDRVVRVQYDEARADITPAKHHRAIHPVTKQDVKNLMDIIDSDKPLSPEEQDFVIRSLGQFLLNELKI